MFVSMCFYVREHLQLGVSHVTVLNLVKAGKLRRISGKAQVSGGGYLYDAEQVKALAKEYQPQPWNKPPRAAPVVAT